MTFQTSIASFARPFLFCLAAAIGSVACAETEKPADALSAIPPKYTLWQGGCSRSMKVLETHTDIHAALRAAERLSRGGSEVIVLSGESDWGRAVAVLLTQRTGTTSRGVVECTVYEKVGCRLGRWQSVNPEGKTDPTTAKKLTEERTKLGGTVLTVYQVSN
jgi:hypothetical protein